MADYFGKKLSDAQKASDFAKKVLEATEKPKGEVKVNETVYRPAAKSLTPGQGYPRQEKQETEQERFDRHMQARRAAFPPEDFGAVRQPSYVQEARFRNDMLLPSEETLGKIHDLVPEAIRNAMGKKLEEAKSYARSIGTTSHGAALANKTEELTKPLLQKYLDHVATPIATKLSGYEPPEIEFDVTPPPTVIPETTVTGNSLSARIGRVMGMGGTEGAPSLRQPRTPEVIAGRSMERDRSGARYDQMVDADRGTKLGLVDTGPEQEDAYKKDPEYEARKAGVKEYGGVSGDVTRKNPQADRKVVQDAFDKAVKKGQ